MSRSASSRSDLCRSENPANHRAPDPQSCGISLVKPDLGCEWNERLPELHNRIRLYSPSRLLTRLREEEMHMESGCDQEESEYFVSTRVCTMLSSHLDSKQWKRVPSKMSVSALMRRPFTSSGPIFMPTRADRFAMGLGVLETIDG